MRWFTFTRDTVSSVPDRTECDKHTMTYPRFTQIEIDEQRLIIKIPNPAEGKRDCTFSSRRHTHIVFQNVLCQLTRTLTLLLFVGADYLLAPSKDIFDTVVGKCESIVEACVSEEKQPMQWDSRPGDEEFIGGEDQSSLIEFPWSGSLLDVTFHILLFPLKGLMHLTIPDVRHLDSEGNPESGLAMAFLAICMCLVWLIIGSYAMVASLEKLAGLMNIPDAVIGVTVSAAGTSLPNYVASKVAAQQGFGVSLLGS